VANEPTDAAASLARQLLTEKLFEVIGVLSSSKTTTLVGAADFPSWPLLLLLHRLQPPAAAAADSPSRTLLLPQSTQMSLRSSLRSVLLPHLLLLLPL